MENQKGFFSEEIELRFRDCDYKKRAKASSLMAYLADIAGAAYHKKGYSHTWLWEHNYVFLLSRVSISITRMPHADERLTVTTWERNIKGALFYRDFSVADTDSPTPSVKASTAWVQASTAWVLANPHTRQILRPSEFTGVIDSNPDIVADVAPLRKIKCNDELQEVGMRTIVYSDIDANGHVYNAIYVSIACDYLPNDFLENDFTEIQINFKHEAKLGEQMIIKTFIAGNTAIVVGEVNETVSFESKFTIK